MLRWPIVSRRSIASVLYDELPGADLFNSAIEDLRAGVESPAALLVALARGRLVDAGLAVPPVTGKRPAHRLYDLLASQDPENAHSRYNALLRRIMSFAQAAEHAAAR
jgi:hypothetical protein